MDSVDNSKRADEILVARGVEVAWERVLDRELVRNFKRPDDSSWTNLVDGDLTAVEDTRGEVFAVAEMLGVSPDGLSIVDEDRLFVDADYLEGQGPTVEELLDEVEFLQLMRSSAQADVMKILKSLLSLPDALLEAFDRDGTLDATSLYQNSDLGESMSTGKKPTRRSPSK